MKFVVRTGRYVRRDASSDNAPIMSAYFTTLKAFNKAVNSVRTHELSTVQQGQSFFGSQLDGFPAKFGINFFCRRFFPCRILHPRRSTAMNKFASGAKSPDAPKDPTLSPREERHGLNISIIRSTVTCCTPDFPKERAGTFTTAQTGNIFMHGILPSCKQ